MRMSDWSSDVCSSDLAEDEGIAVAEKIAGQTGIVNHDVIPSGVYTWPEIAGVGLTEEAAKERGEIKVGKYPMLANSRAKTNHGPDGFGQVNADAKSERVLGGWCIARVAGTMSAPAWQAMGCGATGWDLAGRTSGVWGKRVAVRGERAGRRYR